MIRTNTVLNIGGKEPKLSWADITEQEEKDRKREKNAKKKYIKRKKLVQKTDQLYKTLQEEPEGLDGREIFVGGLEFEDLGKAAVLIIQRREKWSILFERYGKVVCVRAHWVKGYMFVVFAERISAQKVMEELLSYEAKVKLTTQLEREMIADGKCARATPRPNFYMRWPKKTLQNQQCGESCNQSNQGISSIGISNNDSSCSSGNGSSSGELKSSSSDSSSSSDESGGSSSGSDHQQVTAAVVSSIAVAAAVLDDDVSASASSSTVDSEAMCCSCGHTPPSSVDDLFS